MGEIRDITMHVQHADSGGPTPEDFADAITHEFGDGPVHFDVGNALSLQETREEGIVFALERARDIGMGFGMMSSFFSLVPYGLEAPNIGNVLLGTGIGAFVLGVVAAYVKDGYEGYLDKRYFVAR